MRPSRIGVVLFAVSLAACGAADEASQNEGGKSTSAAALGKADGLGATTLIAFNENLSDPAPSSPLVAGSTVGLRYATRRMYKIIDSSLQMGYFASSFHCYGYGCCEVSFPDLRAFYRFNDQGQWIAAQLDKNGAADLSIPADARVMEVWFKVDGFDLKSWYCGCDGSCSQENYARAGSSYKSHAAWDSRYGKNFRFDVQERRAASQLVFGALNQSPQLSEAIKAGQPLEVRFKRDRFHDIVDYAGQRDGHYFAYSFHCYGYGCCEVGFPAITISYRFSSDGTWHHQALGEGSDGYAVASLDPPADARGLELYFSIERFNLRSWYCGCDPACANQSYQSSQPRDVDFRAWDSSYGRNYHFEVAP